MFNLNYRSVSKFLVALAAAAGVAATVIVDGNVSTSDLIEVALAAAGAAGVYQVRNVDAE